MAPRRAFRSALPALAAAAALALSACGGAPTSDPSSSSQSAAPTIDARPTPASSTAPARNIAVPELPEAAKQNTKEGFEAFVYYYVSLLDYAYQTGDTGPARAKADDGCTMCKVATEDIDRSFKSGMWNVGGNVSISAFATDGEPDINGLWVAQVTLNQSELANASAARGVSTSHPATSASLLATAEYANGDWSMFDLGLPQGARR